jgi:WD40 repeat protein
LDPNESKKQDKLKRKYLKRLERATLLVRLVDLDVVSYEVADIAPQTEYELYIGNFGSSNSAQATTQYPDTNEIDTMEVQTEKIHYKNKDIQVPEDLGLFAQPTGLIPQDKDKKRQMQEEAKFVRIDTIGLSKFMSKAYPVFRVLLNESERSSNAGTQKSTLEFSESFISMSHLPLLTGRSVVGMSFSNINQQFLLAVYSATKTKKPLGVNPDEDISHLDGVAAIWNINNPQAPHTLQVCDGALTCGCWSAKRGYLFFCGSKDGAVYVWDQREPEHMHSNSIRSVIKKNPKGRNSKRMESLTPRAPTYSTEWMWKENHQAPIVRILPVGYNCKSQADGSEQVATLDSAGTIMFWVIVELDQKAREISDTDFGLNIFGNIKLAKSSQLTVVNPQRYMNPEIITSLDPKSDDVGLARGRPKEETGLLPEIATNDLEFQPDDPSQMMIATDTGYVLHCSRFSHLGNASPATYHSSGPNEFLEPLERARHMAIPRDLKFGTSILSLHYCPTDPRFFAAAYNDGTISLFKTEDNIPKTTFKSFTKYPIICVRWSNRSRGVFFALDASGTLFAFDLMRERPEQQLEPCSRSDVMTKTTTNDGKEKVAAPTVMEWSSDLRAEPKLAIAYDNGHIDLHNLKPDFIKQERNEGFFVAFY